MSYIDKEQLLQATNGGLDIILSYFPQASDCVNDSRKKFKQSLACGK
jgi:hypothetical protein